MERGKNEQQRQAFFNLFNDVSHAKDDIARAAALNRVRKIRGDSVDVSIIMSLAHAHAISKREKYMQTNTHEAKRDMQIASAVAAYIGLDNTKVRNPYRNNKSTDGQTLVLDTVKSMYNTASDENKTLLDEHYQELYGKTCPELITQISVPAAERHRLIPIDAKKIRTAAIGTAAIGTIAWGVAAPANAAQAADISLSPSAYTTADMQIIPASLTTEVFSNLPSATSGEITLNPVAPPDGGNNSGGEVELKPVAPPDSGNNGGEVELDPVAPPDSGNNGDNNGEIELDPVAPSHPPESTTPPEAPHPSQPPASEKPEAPQPPSAKPIPPKPDRKPHSNPNHKKEGHESESQKEKEAKAYKVYTDYVRANVASLQGNSRWHPMDADKVIHLIDKYYNKYKHENNGVISREYIAAVLWQESKYDPKASSGVADGIGQFTKGTVDFVGEHIHFNDPWNPDQSVEASFWYYNYIYKKFDGYSNSHNWPARKDTVSHKLEMSLAGYNAGPFMDMFKKGNMPNYGETNDYRRIIMGDYNDMKKEQRKILGSTHNNDNKHDKKDESKHEKRHEKKTVGYGYNLKGDQELIYYNQFQNNGDAPYAGGTMGYYGCGPSTLATIVSTLKGENISNLSVAHILQNHGAVVNGSGTNRQVFNNPNFGAFNDLGIEVKRINISDAAFKKTIDEGGMVLMRQYGAVFSPPNTGHFMAVTGYNNNKSELDGTNHKYLIADPNGNKGRNYTARKDGFSFSTLKGANRPRTGNLTHAWAVTLTHGKDAPKSDVAQIRHNNDQIEASHKAPKKHETKTETVIDRKPKTQPKIEAPKEISLNPITGEQTPNVFDLKPVAPPETSEPKVVDEPKVNNEPKETEAPTSEPSESTPTAPETTPDKPETTPEAPQTTAPEDPNTIELAPAPTEEPAPVETETPAPTDTQVSEPAPETPTVEPTAPETIAPVSNTDTPQPLVDGQTVVLRNKFNANHVITDVPTLTRQQMQQAHKASR